MITCTKIWTNFPFGHKQPSHKGHCRFIHGHNWDFHVEFIAKERDECGFVVDFGGLKDLKKELDAMFDHTFLINEDDPDLELLKLLSDNLFADTEAGESRPELASGGIFDLRVVKDCSCEGIAELVFKMCNDFVGQLTSQRVRVLHVTIFEDSKNSASCTTPSLN